MNRFCLNVCSSSTIRKRWKENSSSAEKKIEENWFKSMSSIESNRKNFLSFFKQQKRQIFEAIAKFFMFTVAHSPTIFQNKNQSKQKVEKDFFLIWLNLSFVIGRASNFSSLRSRVSCVFLITRKKSERKMWKMSKKTTQVTRTLRG